MPRRSAPSSPSPRRQPSPEELATWSREAPERYLAARDEVLGAVIADVGAPGLSAEKAPLFQSLAHSITYQQLNGKAAASILAKWTALVPGKKFPTAAQFLTLSDEALRGAGLSFAKIAAIRDLAAKHEAGALPGPRSLTKLDDEALIEALTTVRGVGTWTVEMFLMFRLGRPDVLPIGDFGVRAGFQIAYGLPEMPTPKELLAHGERWRPHRSLASWYLWRAVDRHRERQKLAELSPKLSPKPPATAKSKTKR
jgi:DNA-3-methyladenine glycosylase II